MHPATLLQVKQIVRGSRFGILRKFSQRVMRLRDTQAVHDHVDRLNTDAD